MEPAPLSPTRSAHSTGWFGRGFESAWTSWLHCARARARARAHTDTTTLRMKRYGHWPSCTCAHDASPSPHLVCRAPRSRSSDRRPAQQPQQQAPAILAAALQAAARQATASAMGWGCLSQLAAAVLGPVRLRRAAALAGLPLPLRPSHQPAPSTPAWRCFSCTCSREGVSCLSFAWCSLGSDKSWRDAQSLEAAGVASAQ